RSALIATRARQLEKIDSPTSLVLEISCASSGDAYCTSTRWDIGRRIHGYSSCASGVLGACNGAAGASGVLSPLLWCLSCDVGNRGRGISPARIFLRVFRSATWISH